MATSFTDSQLVTFARQRGVKLVAGQVRMDGTLVPSDDLKRPAADDIVTYWGNDPAATEFGPSVIRAQVSEYPGIVVLPMRRAILVISRLCYHRYMTNQLRLAGCIITNEKGSVLLLHRNTPKRTQWEVLGGKIDEFEDGYIVETGPTAMDTVLKEIDEEVGVSVVIVRQLGAKEFTEDGFTMHYSWFVGTIVKGVPKISAPDKYDDLKYFWT